METQELEVVKKKVGSLQLRASKTREALTLHSLRHFADWLDSRGAIHFIVALALLLRVAALAFLSRHPLVGDDRLYHDFAVGLLQGAPIYPLVPPGMGFYLAVFYRFFGITPFVARACMLPLAVGFMYVLYAVSVRFAGRKGANLIALVFAIYPLHVLCSVEPITEMPASLLLLISVSLVLTICIQPRLRDFALLGIVLGLLVLTRPSALPMLGFVPLYLVWRSRKWFASVLVAVIPTLMIACWIWTVYTSTGHFVMINFSSSQNVFLGNNEYTPLYRTWWFSTHVDESQLPAGYQQLNREIVSLPWYEENVLFRRLAWQSIAARPGMFAVRTANRIRVYFAFDSFTSSLLLNRYSAGRKLAFAVLALDGGLYVVMTLSAILFLLTLSRASERFWSTLTILGTALIYASPYFFSVSHPVYHFPILPLIGLLAAALWSDILDGRIRLSRTIFGTRAKQIVATAAVVLFVYIQVEYAVVMYLYSSR